MQVVGSLGLGFFQLSPHYDIFALKEFELLLGHDGGFGCLLKHGMNSKVIDFELLKHSLPIDPFFALIMEDVSARVQGDFRLYNGFLFKGTQLCISGLWLKIIHEGHNEGHMGRDKTLQLVAD